ncbi:MAG: RIP metalloprotease RseP [Candidatus Eiseniibacteriota bacterium]
MVQILTVYGPAFLIALSVLVFFHELGHYLAARWNGVRVEVFSIGFGRELFGWTDSHGTRWKFSIMPLGGYVKMFGDVNAASAGSPEIEGLSPDEKAVCFQTKRVGQRAAIVFAGPLANYILAVVILALLYIFVGQQSTPAVVNEVLPGSAAAVAGIKPGDKVVMVDGSAIERFEELRQVVSLRPDQTMQMDVLRDGHIVHLTVTPQRHRFQDKFGNWHEIGLLGVGGRGVETVRYGPATALWRAVIETKSVTGATITSIGQMFAGTRKTDDIGGPLRIAEMSGQMIKLGPVEFIWFLAVLSLHLGLINLVPVPMLDGGHLLFYGIEALRGRPLGERAQEYGFKIGLALVLTLMVFATWNDLFVHFRVVDLIKGLVS